jgi:hypothetical protein
MLFEPSEILRRFHDSFLDNVLVRLHNDILCLSAVVRFSFEISSL